MIYILDAFCGAGGCAMGYYRALGGEATIVGVDRNYQKNYPFFFLQMDAIKAINRYGAEFDFIHASPPCQIHSNMTPDKSKHVDLIPPTRDALERTRTPYVIENVRDALDAMIDPIMLCGSQFNGLKVYRHRLFESNQPIRQPVHHFHHDNTPAAGHGVSDKGYISVTSGGNSIGKDKKRRTGVDGMSRKGFVSVTGHFTGIDYCRKAMGISWMLQKELAQAIPPPMTQYVGAEIFKTMGLPVTYPPMNVLIENTLL